ncbi:MAG: TonB-dependent receptor, partial [Acidobacteria bacterium]|nr:TonB-dependent receptor [Acidobacteriota bacterium]
VLAVRVDEYREPVFGWEGGQLRFFGVDSVDKATFISAVNKAEFREAESILEARPRASDLRLQGYLALLGHPAIEGDDEARLLAQAKRSVTAAMTTDRPSIWAVETGQSLGIFSRARRRFHNRGMAEEGHFQENRKVVSLMRIIRPKDLLYWKALEYQGRALQMLDRHRWVYPSGDALAVWRELIEAFPNNRYARFYLKDEWTPDRVWSFGDHLQRTEGAPEWAVAQREAWSLLLDVCEWWAANKQHADGSIGGASDRFAGTFAATGGRHQELRGGRGGDSHNVLIRFLGLPTETVQDILGTRMVDTDYGSAGVTGKASYRVRETGTVTGFYLHNEQFDIRRYDRLLGGDGRNIAAFKPQILDFGYARYQDVIGNDIFIEATYSVNRQTDGREDQRFPDSTLRIEENSVTAFGYEFMASSNAGEHLLSMGAEVYDEYIDSFRDEARGGEVTPVRPRVPNGSRYTSFGVFILDDWTAVADRVQLTGGVRFSHFRAATNAEDNIIDGVPVVPTTKETFSDITFNVGTTGQLSDEASIYGRVARGFRAPSLFDIGETGLTGGGFEVAPEEAVALDALIGDSAGNNAVSTGIGWTPLAAELLWSFETGFRWRQPGRRFDFSFFDSELADSISRRTMIVPTDVVGEVIGGEEIIAQDDAGRIFVAVDPDPVVSRANINRSRVWGIEWLFEQEVSRSTLFVFKGGVQRGRELDTGFWARKIAPDHFDAIVRWNRTGGRLWLEAVFIGMLAQDHLNPADIEDVRIGAFRDADSIAAYFNNGAVELGVVSNGILLATGETLEEVQLRLLGAGLEGNPLFALTPGWWTVSLRGGFNINASSELTFSIANIFDRNYRLHGSGFDSPGFSAIAAWQGRF